MIMEEEDDWGKAMPIAFHPISLGRIPIGVFTIDTDILLMDHHFFIFLLFSAIQQVVDHRYHNKRESR